MSVVRFEAKPSGPTAAVALAPNSGVRHAHNFTNRYLDDETLAKPSRSVADAIKTRTQEQMDKILGVKSAVTGKSIGNQVQTEQTSQFIKYTSNQPGAVTRVVHMREAVIDPLNPPQFKHKRVARGPPSPPVTIMRSPPRKLTVQDQQEWKVPPSISNWKNPRGYTIPLEMRLSADGRTLRQHTINEKFSNFADAMYITEQELRRSVEERNQIEQSNQYREFLKREDEMRLKAREAKEEKERAMLEHMQAQQEETDDALTARDKKAMMQRDIIRQVNRREQERELRMARAGINKSKVLRDAERDISERVALGQAQPTLTDTLIDQRLMNQDGGLDGGFKDDDTNGAYDKPLFANRQVMNIYGGLKDLQDGLEEDGDAGDSQLHEMLRKRPRGLDGNDENVGTLRTKPVQFEKGGGTGAGEDYFGMNDFVAQKKRKVD